MNVSRKDGMSSEAAVRPVGEKLLHRLTMFRIRDVTLGSEQLRGLQLHDLMTS